MVDPKTYGRLYNTRRICQVLVYLTICATDTDLDKQDNSPRPSFQSLNLTLMTLPQWSKEHWETFQKLFQTLQTDFLRKDAAAKPCEPQDDSVHSERARSELYNYRLTSLLRYMQVQKILSPFHDDLLQQLKSTTEEATTVTIDAERVQNLW